MHTETWLDIVLDPNHIFAELIWNILFDVLIISIGYGIIIKKMVLPYIHKYIDNKHGIYHKESDY
jgi:hypothetical protein